MEELEYLIYYDPSFFNPHEKTLVLEKMFHDPYNNTLEQEVLHFSTKIPITKAYDTEPCVLILIYEHQNLLIAYPQYISIEEMAVLFPRCWSLFLKSPEPIDFSDFSMFHNLTNLNITSPQSNLNGIEFLSSLVSFTLSDFLSIDLCQLNGLQLKKLDIYDKNLGNAKNGIENLSMRHLELLELEELEIGCSNVYIENVTLPKLRTFQIICNNLTIKDHIELLNLESLVFDSKFYPFLKYFLITNKCYVGLFFDDDDDESIVKDIINQAQCLVPEGTVIYRDD
jgi:hypothetical protein